MAEIRDHLKARAEHIEAEKAAAAAARAESEAMNTATLNGQPLPDGVYSEETDPKPVWLKVNGKFKQYTPVSFASHDPLPTPEAPK